MTTEASELAGRALEERLKGNFKEADRLFKQAVDLVDGWQQADIMLNWADTIRRWPEDIEEARELLQQAEKIAIDASAASNYANKVLAAIIHHQARLERQAGSYEEAARLLSTALSKLDKYVWDLRGDKPLPIDVVTMRLDMASIEALCGHPEVAWIYAVRALSWMRHRHFWRKKKLTLKHVARALVLMLGAWFPKMRLVRWAFFSSLAEGQR